MMSRKKISRWIAVGFLSVVLLSASQGQALPGLNKDLLIGVKIYDYSGDFGKLFDEWRRLGINTAFVSPALESKQAFRNLAKKNGLATFIIFHIFYNPEALEKRPDFYALTEALKPPSVGVVFWNWDALDKSPEKKDAVRAAVKLLD